MSRNITFKYTYRHKDTGKKFVRIYTSLQVQKGLPNREREHELIAVTEHTGDMDNAEQNAVKEIRTKNDFTLPCPDCGAECLPDKVTKLERHNETADAGVTVVLPQHYLDLRCEQCGLQLWVGLDENGKPLDLT